MTATGVSVDALALAVPGARLIGSGAPRVSGLSYDSRLVQPGDLFTALRGADFDGHAFIPEAERRGAVALLVETVAPSKLPQIVVNNSRAALAALSANFFGHPSQDLSVIGITGTDGKTTTSYLVDHILRSTGVTTGMIGTVAIRIGEHEDLHTSRQTTPESNDIQRYLRQMLDGGVEWAILEATSHGLAMHRLDHVRFRIGAVTNITHEHLDFHGNEQNYRRAKGMLLERVAAESGVAVVNADDPGARAIVHRAEGASLIRYSTAGADADLRAHDIQSDVFGSQFQLDAGPHGRSEVMLPLIGEFNVANAVCAAGIAIAANVTIRDIVAALATAPPVPGRMARVEAGQPFTVVVDYAHTPDAMEKVLVLLRRLHPGGRMIVVFGSAGERDVDKSSRHGAVGARLADISVVTSEDPRFEDPETIIQEIAAGSLAAGAQEGVTLFRRTDRKDAIQLAFELARAGDCVLLAGKGHEGSIIWGREKLPWDEGAVARDLLHEVHAPRGRMTSNVG